MKGNDPDPEYVWSIVDVVRPSVVRDRAIEVVGERFAGVWIERDAADEHYAVAIVEPTANDAVEIEARIPGIPFEIVARSIPLAELEALRDTIVANVRPGPESIVSVSPGPASGLVHVGILAEAARERAKEAIEAATGRSLQSLPIDIGVTGPFIEEGAVTSSP